MCNGTRVHARVFNTIMQTNMWRTHIGMSIHTLSVVGGPFLPVSSVLLPRVPRRGPMPGVLRRRESTFPTMMLRVAEFPPLIA